MVNNYCRGERDDRPWGSWTVLDVGPGYVVKRLRVLPGGRLSLQRHHHRAERWVVAAGTPIVTLDAERRTLTPGDAVIIPIRAVHRLENEGAVDAVILEVGLGDELREDDIERLDDIYGRADREPVACAPFPASPAGRSALLRSARSVGEHSD